MLTLAMLLAGVALLTLGLSLALAATVVRRPIHTSTFGLLMIAAVLRLQPVLPILGVAVSFWIISRLWRGRG